MNNLAIHIAASTLVLATMTVGFKTAEAQRPASTSRTVSPEQAASRASGLAQEAAQQGNVAQALAFAEEAVEYAPRDAGYRMLLADLYLRSGRFQSAETSYGDVLELQPGNVRAGLSRALAQVALGKNYQAMLLLDTIAPSAAPGDLGLAYALAGRPDRAIELLEPVARGPQANGRIRQNLALAYALAGDWQRARSTAAQDVSPADLGQRLQQWAAMAKPGASWDQVAFLLGVTPAQDPGQPVRLALAPPAPEPVAFAEAAPVAHAFEAPAPVPAPVPVVYAAAPLPTLAAPPAPEAPQAEEQAEPSPHYVRYAEAARALAEMPAPVIRASAPAVPPARPTFERPRPEPKPAAAAVPQSSGPGRFVVQLGAFSNVENAQRAWSQAERRHRLGEAQPFTTTIDHGGRTLHRVSVAGFDSQAAAARLCGSIKAQGGACFVRATAGDQLASWAPKGNTRRA